MGEYVDFKAVKAEASIEAVARQYGVNLRRTNGSHERGKCPLPTHPAGDDAKSFSINTAKQVWICHSTACAKGRRGKKGGDVIELVAVMESSSLRDAGLKLASWFGIETASDQRPSEPSAENNGMQSPIPPRSVEQIPDERYGIYDPLAEWIELRAANEDLSPFEKSAFLSVLGKIEDLVRDEGGGS